MKKVFFLLWALIATTSLVLAADMAAAPTAPVTSPAAGRMAAEKTAVGAVKSVSTADAAKGTKSEIVVADQTGKSTDVLVKTTTTLYDADAKAIMLDKIAAGAKVSVVYTTTPEGMNEAKSVKIVK